jgi:hypothetical protein
MPVTCNRKDECEKPDCEHYRLHEYRKHCNHYCHVVNERTNCIQVI